MLFSLLFMLFIPDCHMNTIVYLFHNCGWVLVIPDGDLATTVYFFTPLDGCWLFLIVNWTSLFFFLQLWMGVVYS